MSHPSNSSNRSDSVRHVSVRHSPVRSGKKRFNKRRFWLLIAILAVVEALAFCLAMQWKYIFPTREVSELYAHYADVEGIEASFIKDYRVNDSVFVDVTVLEAITDSAWDKLVSDFKIPPPSEVYLMSKEKRNVIMRRAPRENPMETISRPSPNDYVVSISRFDRTVCVFNTMDSSQIQAIITYKIKNIKNSQSLNQSK